MNIPDVVIEKDVSMPQLGLGLWRNKDEAVCIASVRAALESGYRHFDTAQVYGNEAYLGRALKESDYKRKDIFITTKIGVQNFGHNHALKSFERSLVNLQSDYVDLLLLHFPVSLLRARTWRAAEELYQAGKARTIGVSNYTIRHLEELLARCQIKPAVNQVELHVFLQQPELVKFCNEQGILVEAYLPLAHAHGLDDALLAQVAAKHNKTPTQVMLRWCIEIGAVPLPKSTHADRIAENCNIFDFSLDLSDMQELKTLDQGLRTCWDPTLVP